ncbi:MAG: hypothetical protein GX442_17370 [Candidatus Riflebacteria bacterium]|nr:hypothetical protein [Candidatus Riflebacteria bacterium]
MKRAFLLYFLVFSLCQGFWHDGRELLPRTDGNDLQRLEKALAPGDVLTVPEPTARFSHDLCLQPQLPLIPRCLRIASIAGEAGSVVRPPAPGQEYRAAAGFHPREWGMVVVRLPRGDG